MPHPIGHRRGVRIACGFRLEQRLHERHVDALVRLLDEFQCRVEILCRKSVLEALGERVGGEPAVTGVAGHVGPHAADGRRIAVAGALHPVQFIESSIVAGAGAVEGWAAGGRWSVGHWRFASIGVCWIPLRYRTLSIRHLLGNRH